MKNETMTEQERKIVEGWPSKAILQLVSVGKLCETCQCTITAALAAAVSCEAVPVAFIDGVCFFDEQSVEKIMVHIAHERQAASASAETAAQKGMN